MKYLFLLMLLLCGAANACNNGAINYPQCDKFNTPPPVKTHPAKTTRQTSNLSQEQTQQQQQQARSRSTSSAESSSNANGTNDNLLDASDKSYSKFQALALSFGGPSFTPPNAAQYGCAFTNQESSASSYGPLYSRADSRMNTDHCLQLHLIDLWWQKCKYKMADMALMDMSVTQFPTLKGYDLTYAPDLTKEACDKLKLPVLPPVDPKDSYDLISKPPKDTPLAKQIAVCKAEDKKPVKKKAQKSKCTTLCCK